MQYGEVMNKVLDRMKQIKIAREHIKQEKYVPRRFVSAEVFMEKVKTDSLWGDSVNAALLAFIDADDGLLYTCPIEDFSCEQLLKIEEIKGVPCIPIK